MVVRVWVRLIGPLPAGVLANRFSPSLVAGGCAAGQSRRHRSAGRGGQRRQPGGHISPGRSGAAAGLDDPPSTRAIIPSLVDEQRLGLLNSWYSAVAESAMFAAPALDTLLLRWVSPTALIAADSLSFALAAAGIITLPALRPPSPAVAPRGR
jgi:hypothetical protein